MSNELETLIETDIASESHGGWVKTEVLKRVLAKSVDLVFALMVLEVIPGLLGLVAGVSYILLSDGFLKGRSIGKGLVGLRVLLLPAVKLGSDELKIGSDEPEKSERKVDRYSGLKKNDYCGYRESVIRNVTIAVGLLFFYLFDSVILSFLVFGFEVLLMLGNSRGKRLGDIFAETTVIDDGN